MIDTRSFLQLASSLPTSNSRGIVDRAQDGFAIIFIPGILGSTLSDAHGNIWGSRVLPRLDRLIFSPDRVVNASILQSYPLGVSRLDVYGEFSAAALASVGATVPIMEFAYDWRVSITDIADSFNRKLLGDWRNKLDGRRIVVVAHSMGGVVAWDWKNRHYKDGEYGFSVDRMILLGSPLEGSCEMLRMLLEGYRPIPDAGPFEEQIFSKLFSDLHPAAFTFPSVFQLLPEFPADHNDRNSCLALRNSFGTNSIDHFSITAWRRILSNLLDTQYRLGFLSTRKPIWESLDMSKDRFFLYLTSLLDQGRVFRQGFSLSETPLNGRIEYFYSEKFDTTGQIILTIDEEETEVDDYMLRPGDGRVLGESATIHLKVGRVPRLTQSAHGDLVKDHSFIGYVRDWLRIAVTRRVAILIHEDESARRAFVETGSVLPLHEVGVVAFAWDPTTFDTETQAVLALGQAALSPFITDSASMRGRDYARAVYQLGRRADDELSDKTLAFSLYGLALATGSLEQDDSYAFALNRYAYAAIQRGYGDTSPALGEAASAIENNLQGFPTSFQSNVFNNLGMAYEIEGNTTDAATAYERAKSLGSANATTNLERLRAVTRSSQSTGSPFQ